jgi:hypothetical protein
LPVVELQGQGQGIAGFRTAARAEQHEVQTTGLQLDRASRGNVDFVKLAHTAALFHDHGLVHFDAGEVG